MATEPLQRLQELEKELDQFKLQPKFGYFGFGRGGPYAEWIMEVGKIYVEADSEQDRTLGLRIKDAAWELHNKGMEAMWLAAGIHLNRRLPNRHQRRSLLKRIQKKLNQEAKALKKRKDSKQRKRDNDETDIPDKG